MMRVNSTTFLFEELTEAEAEEIQSTAEAIVLHGKVPEPLPTHINEWYAAIDCNEHEKPLILWTTYPQRAFLSVLRFCEDNNARRARLAKHEF